MLFVLTSPFQCPSASYIWTFHRVSFDWPVYPTSVEGLFVEVFDHVNSEVRNVMFFLYVQALWTLWKTRNNVRLQQQHFGLSSGVIHKTIMLLKPMPLGMGDELIDKMKQGVTLALRQSGGFSCFCVLLVGEENRVVLTVWIDLFDGRRGRVV